ncbi:MAG: thiol peroxidase [Anaerolineae bacterium]
MTERVGGVTSRGNPLTVVGAMLKPGDAAPEFALPNNMWSLEAVSLAESAGKVRLINVVPSLNTGICDAQTRRFSEEVGKYGDRVAAYTISVDLPIAQKQWCDSAGIDNIQMLSDYRDMSFGTAYGTHIKEIRIEQRAVFVVDGDGVVRYAEYVPEIGQHPDYEAALTALQETISD